MLTASTNLVDLLTKIQDVCAHPLLSAEEKHDILTEMRSEIPADRLCRFSPKTLQIVKAKLEEAINGKPAQAKSKSPAKNGTKATPKSPKA